MNQDVQNSVATEEKENALAGAVGAFLFALAGGAIYFVLYLIGFYASISGLVAAVCAIKGYSVFAKKESTKGIVISIIMAVLVIVIAWYLCLSYDVYDVYQLWLEEGEVDVAPTFFQSISIAYLFLSEAPGYFIDLVLGLAFCALGAFGSVKTALQRVKAQKANASEPAVDGEDYYPSETGKSISPEADSGLFEEPKPQENGAENSEESTDDTSSEEQ